MTAAAVLFPPDIFVDQVLVMVRDSNLLLPASTMPHAEHARQAAALAGRGAHPDTLVAAALLCGIGDLVVGSWSRHPSTSHRTTPANEAAAMHLSHHLPPCVTEPIRLLSRARRYLNAVSGTGLALSATRRQFESEPHAAAAIDLADIDRRAGKVPMLTPALETYRDMLFSLAHQHAVSMTASPCTLLR